MLHCVQGPDTEVPLGREAKPGAINAELMSVVLVRI
jgi:hypothetical protein